MRHSITLAVFLIALIISATAAYAQLVSVDVEEIEFRELYAVEYHVYTKESIGTATIYNPSSQELRADIVLSGERYINAPMKITARLPGGQRTKIPLYIDLDIGVLDLSRQTEHIPVNIDITAYLGEAQIFRSDDIARYIELHDRHKIPYDIPAKIAMFVDPRDKYVMSEVSSAIGNSKSTPEEKAAAAFELLRRKGIYCIGSGSAQIQYPRELLRIRLGTVYDGSLLYVAVLESLDVETKLVFSPNEMLPFYKHQGRWYPVDINMLAGSFDAARSSGEKLKDAMLRMDSQTVVLREAWKKYPPLWFPVLASKDIPLFSSANKYIEEDKLEDAADVLDQLLKKYPSNPVLLNNAANVELLMGNLEQAVAKYNLAVNRAPNDGGLYLNMGIAYHRMGDEIKSMEYMGKAHTKLGSYVAMHNMLNLDEENGAYAEIDILLRKASRGSEISSIALAARSLTNSGYPLYWKRFHDGTGTE